jgi:hypothetical protein
MDPGRGRGAGDGRHRGDREAPAPANGQRQPLSDVEMAGPCPAGRDTGTRRRGGLAGLVPPRRAHRAAAGPARRLRRRHAGRTPAHAAAVPGRRPAVGWLDPPRRVPAVRGAGLGPATAVLAVVACACGDRRRRRPWDLLAPVPGGPGWRPGPVAASQQPVLDLRGPGRGHAGDRPGMARRAGHLARTDRDRAGADHLPDGRLRYPGPPRSRLPAVLAPAGWRAGRHRGGGCDRADDRLRRIHRVRRRPPRQGRGPPARHGGCCRHERRAARLPGRARLDRRRRAGLAHRLRPRPVHTDLEPLAPSLEGPGLPNPQGVPARRGAARPRSGRRRGSGPAPRAQRRLGAPGRRPGGRRRLAHLSGRGHDAGRCGLAGGRPARGRTSNQGPRADRRCLLLAPWAQCPWRHLAGTDRSNRYGTAPSRGDRVGGRELSSRAGSTRWRHLPMRNGRCPSSGAGCST